MNNPLADQDLAQLSNWLMYSAIAVYLLAFVAACAEWAFGSRGKVARASARLADEAKPTETAARTAPAARPCWRRPHHRRPLPGRRAVTRGPTCSAGSPSP